MTRVINLKVEIDPDVGTLSKKELDDIAKIVKRALLREKLLVDDVTWKRGRLGRMV